MARCGNCELHSNTFANGRVLFTYDENTSEWGVALSDWLGAKRVQVDPAIVGNLTSFQSLPFGDGLVFAGYGEDSTEHHFTGKEHDFESGNDYFGARYYTSSTGRFLSPDPGWIAAIDPSNPQSLNLYSYALNNPSKFVDPSGMILCNYGPTQDSADYEDAESADECINTDKGKLVVDQESVTVTATATSAPSLTPSSSGSSTIPNTPNSSSTVPLPPAQVKCSGNARVLQGNPNTIGKPGGFSGPSVGNFPVTANGAAVIPSQWAADKSALRPFINQVSGVFPNVNVSFQGLVDTIGSTTIPNVQSYLMNKFPGDLIVELPGATQDYGVTAVTVTAPSALGCPAGTVQVP